MFEFNENSKEDGVVKHLEYLKNKCIQDVNKTSNNIKRQKELDSYSFDNLAVISNTYLESSIYSRDEGLTYKRSFIKFLILHKLLNNEKISLKTHFKMGLYGYVSSFTFLIFYVLLWLFLFFILNSCFESFYTNFIENILSRKDFEVNLILYYVCLIICISFISLITLIWFFRMLRHRFLTINIARRMKNE